MAKDLNRSIKIYLDNSAAMTSADQLQQRIGELENKLLGLQTAGKGNTEQAKKLEKELVAQTKKFETYKQKVADTERVLKNLSGATYDELIKAKGAVDKQLKSTTRNTELYNQRLQVQKSISRELALAQKDLRTEIGCQSTMWGRSADFINKYMGLIGSAVAAVTGITMAFGKLRDERDKLEASSANTKALTGLGDEDVQKLEDAAKRLSTTVTKEGVRIKQSAVEISDSFAVIGSQRPELLKSAEALEQVTQDAIYLSIAGKDKLEPAAKALTTVMNQMNLGADQSRRIINAIAAGSQAGAGNIQYITDAFEKSGTSANLMNIQLEQHIGLIEAVAPKYAEASMAGNSLDKVLLKMKEKNIGYKDGVFDLSRAIDEIAARFKKGESAASLFGAEHAKMAEILVMNKADIIKYTEAVTGTNKAVEQANINSDINEVKRAQARNKMNLLGIELMEKLNPAINSTMNQMVHWTGKLVTVADWLSKNGKLVVSLVTVLGLYTVALKLNTYWTTLKGKATSADTLAEQKKLIVLRGSIAAEYASAAAKALLTGNIKAATIAMRGFLVTLGLNPIVAIGVAIAALTVGIYKLATRTTDAKEAMNSFMELSVKEQTELNKLYGALKRSGEGTEQRTKLINEFNAKYGEYLPNLLSEKSTLEDIKTAYENATKAMNENLAQKTLDAKVEEIETNALENKVKELNEVREKLSDLPESMIADAISGIVSQVDEGKSQGLEMQTVWRNVIENIRKVYFKDGLLPSHLGNELEDYVNEVYKAADKVKAVKEELSNFLPKKKEEPTMLPEVVVTPDKKSTTSVGTKTKDSEFKSAMDLKLKEMETAHASELALLKKQKLENEQTEQFYNLSVISSDVVYYQKRLDKLQEFLKKAGSDKIKAEINKQIVEAQTSILDIEQKRDKEKLAVLQDNRDKRLSIEEQCYIAEKAIFEKDVLERNISEEQAKVLLLSLDAETANKRLAILQDYSNDVESIELKNRTTRDKAEEEANKATLDADLKAAQARANQQKAIQNAVSDFKGEFGLLSPKEETKIQLDILKAVYEAKKELAKGNVGELTKLDAAYQRAKTNIEKEGENNRLQIRQQFGIATIQEDYNAELEALRRKHKQELIEDEDFEKAKAQLKVKYLKSSFDYYSGMFSGAISALQDAELANIDTKYDAEIQRAGDNTEEVARLEKEKEQKKLEIQKKYAGVQFAIKVSEIIANTAVAIMQAFAQMGPIAGAIAAVMLGTTGAAQIAVANAERKKIMNMTVDGSSSGGGTGARVANGGGSGFSVGGYTGEGSPLAVAGPAHYDEYVVPSFVVHEPAAMNHVAALEAMRRQKTNANPMPVAGFANGGYTGRDVTADGGSVDKKTSDVLLQLVSLFTKLDKSGLKAYVIASELQKEQIRLDESRKIGSKS